MQLLTKITETLTYLRLRARGVKQTDNDGHTSLFHLLPNELVLAIVDHLQTPSQVAFSLTCKRFRQLLTAYLPLSLADTDVRIQFLWLLQRDLPRYYTCTSCGWMFQWEKRKLVQFRCPRQPRHHYKYDRAQCLWGIDHDTFDYRIYFSRELLGLCYRAHWYGTQYGLSLSFFNSDDQERGKWKHRDDWSRWNQARMIAERLLTYTIWSAKCVHEDDLEVELRHFNVAACLHNDPSHWLQRPGKRAIKAGMLNSQNKLYMHTSKCRFCSCDSRLEGHKIGEKHWQITLRVWRCFEVEVESLQWEHTLTERTRRALAEQEVEQRDLEALYNQAN